MSTKRMFLKSAAGAVALAPLLVSASASVGGPRAGYFPNAALQTHEGRKVRFYDDVVKGNKLVIFNMMYTACTNICPPDTANLLQVQEMLGERVGRDIFMYSLTLQPELDTPAALQAYASKYGVKPGWTFLTGGRDDMDLIRRKLGFYDRNPQVDADLSRHTGMIRVGNEALDRWCMMPSLLRPRQIVDAIVRL
ncbi:MAG TPA: SCO family protein [Ramlibacter sp.]|nr:SCO family protein [Ramlibacter sp.]